MAPIPPHKTPQTDLAQCFFAPLEQAYLNSLKSSAAEQQQNIRQRWDIENRCHGVLDTAFREVHNQTYQGNATENLSTVRRIVMNLLQIDKIYPKSMPKKRMSAMMDKKYPRTPPLPCLIAVSIQIAEYI